MQELALIPEYMRIDILVVSLSYVVAQLFVNMFIFIYAGGHLGFHHFGHFPNLEKTCQPFFVNLHDV